MDKELKEIIDAILEGETTSQDRADAGNERVDVARDQLRLILSKLDVLQDIDVPAGLTDRTVGHVQNRTNTIVLEEARAWLAREGERESRWAWVLGNMRDLIATAAVMMLVFLVSKPGLQQVRQMAQQYQCASNMQAIGQGIGSYAAGYDGMMPFVATGPQVKPWQPGPSEQSRGVITRCVYLLVKNGHVQPVSLVCPGREGDRFPTLSADQMRNQQDLPKGFPLGFSVRIIQHNDRLDGGASDLIISDRNPIFDDMRLADQDMLDISRIAKQFLEMNSTNHQNRGQNILRRDLGVQFANSRLLPVSNDDIYTIRGTNHYDGTQMPEPGDEFLP